VLNLLSLIESIMARPPETIEVPVNHPKSLAGDAVRRL
jgi:hypothetical protein